MRAVSFRNWLITSPNAGPNNKEVCFSAADRATYLRPLQQNLAPAETRLLAWCLMTNHVHLVLVPGREDSLDVLLRRLHGWYAQMVNTRHLRSSHLWQTDSFRAPCPPATSGGCWLTWNETRSAPG